MEIKNGNHKWETGEAQELSGWGRDDPETASLRQSTRNQLKKMVELPGDIAGESGTAERR